ncbi:hypothetical protein ABB37_05922 [Leptomonas pyrrhocoris]|uniref:Uncharacterized protein n=1 Tax=Leptomonas pyrrhocoris TaxID=157538 RepID=A0A0M9FYY7_LEPPY|nr:hypothetical protein ABB37_05922 [Leptomonas pyrrhocoris]KPA78843.1 hypothetical protein ABB37_05922 [Leptomonas pyrrhocoris]|eukprot:XP_015657282.1 hypothetical protein ABB37_05922 [Leptomonas pyrrhocoris]
MAEAVTALRENSERCVREFGASLMAAMALLGSVLNTPEQIVKKVPFEKLRETQAQMRRALQLEILQVMKMQTEAVARRLAERRNAEPQQENIDAHEELVIEDESSPYGRTHRYTIGREDVISILENEGVMEQAEIYLRLNEVYFHTLMAMIAGEVLNFGEQMKSYKPPMSLGLRLLRYFIIEPWNDFWSELWCIFSLARPSDIRTLKDAIRMTCAYLSATALNLELYFVPGGTYYFGTTLLLGLPVEEESLGLSINRMAGNALGCALGFMVYNNTHNLPQKIAMVLCFVFVQRCCKDHPLYGQTFLYSAAVTMASMVMTVSTQQLMTRLITSNYTIVAYMLCCMFIFPNNSIKICWGYRCKLTKVMSEVIDDVALTLRIRPDCYPTPMALDADNNEPASYPHRNTEAMQMCSQLNVQMSLAHRLLAMCDKWAPFAARQHVIRGSSPFPSAASAMIQFAHKRMVAHLRLLVFGVQLLHRPRCDPVFPATTARLLSGSVGDFLAEFAGCMRLVSQDFIDSLPASRKWSYPLMLHHASQLSRMRVRLSAIHVESFVIASKHLSKSTFGMQPEDYRLLRQETTMREATATPHTSELHVHAGDDEEEKGAHGNNAGAVNLGASSNVHGNLSFADRFLIARRLGASMMEDNTDPDALARLHESIYLPQPREGSFLGSGGGGGVSQKSFAYRAPLRETAVTPQDAFPFTQESAEYGIQQHLRDEAARTRKEEVEVGEGRKAEEDARQPVRGTSSPSSPVSPCKAIKPHPLERKVSRLILVPDHGPELEIPLYRGPAFTYVEDELATEKDTDFAAIMTILCSIYSLIVELEGLTGPVNTISTYQKELHESALAIGFIDKLSEKVTAYRQKIYDRYHFLTPSEEQRRPLHAQSDPFADWRF